MSAAGVFMPPILIFPRVKENLQLSESAPTGGFAEFHRTGYMQTDIFGNWSIKFVEFSHATLDNPVLLILDGHFSHIKNLKFIEYAKANCVVVLCLPPHCTHRLQPLDVGFIGPLNNCFGKEIATLQQQHVTVNLKNIFSIFEKAFIKAAKMEIAINAFKKCGIWPFNPNVFTESDFTASTRVNAPPNDNHPPNNNAPANENHPPNDNAPPSDVNNSESEARIALFAQSIKDVTTLELNTTVNTETVNSQTSIECNNTMNSNVESHVKIPLPLIVQAVKPLINLLNSYSDSSSECIPA